MCGVSSTQINHGGIWRLKTSADSQGGLLALAIVGAAGDIQWGQLHILLKLLSKFSDVFASSSWRFRDRMFLLTYQITPPTQTSRRSSVAAWWGSHKYTVNGQSVPGSTTRKGSLGFIILRGPQMAVSPPAVSCGFYFHRRTWSGWAFWLHWQFVSCDYKVATDLYLSGKSILT